MRGKHLAEGLVQRRVSTDGSHVCFWACSSCCFVTPVLLLPLVPPLSGTPFPLFPLFWFMNLDGEKMTSLTFPWHLVFPSRQNAGNKPHCDFVAIQITDLFIPPDSCCRHLKTSFFVIALWNVHFLILHQILLLKALMKKYKYYYIMLFKYLIIVTM